MPRRVFGLTRSDFEPNEWPRRLRRRPMTTPSSLLAHGGKVLSIVTVDAYNAEMRSAEGFLGDRAEQARVPGHPGRLARSCEPHWR